METTIKELRKLNVTLFFLVENENDAIYYGKINWEKDKIFILGTEQEVSIEDFFIGLDYNLISLYFTRVNAMDRKNSFVVI
jgi:hypothetical protein